MSEKRVTNRMRNDAKDHTRRIGFRSVCIYLFIFSVLSFQEVVFAGETAASDDTSQWESSDNGALDTDSWMEAIRDELKLEELDAFTSEELPEKMTFSTLVDLFCEKGFKGITASAVARWIFDIFFYELAASKEYFLQMLCMTAVFAVLKQIMDSRGHYISEISFLVIYATMMAFLLKSFLLIAEVAEGGITLMTRYLSVLVPAYATTLTLSGNLATAGAFYELSFLMMTLLGWAMKLIFVPGIHIYLLLRFLDQLFEEERLSKLAELIESGICHATKAGLAAVVGISCVQAMLSPAKDRLSESVVVRSVSALPGMGGILGSAGDILLSCGILIKNSVGVAALVVLLAVCLTPIIKVFLFTLLYRGLAAVLQPVADKRLINGIHSTAKASGLYLTFLKDSMLMFFLTVAMVTASTSFIF